MSRAERIIPDAFAWAYAIAMAAPMPSEAPNMQTIKSEGESD